MIAREAATAPKVVHFSTVHPATDIRVLHKECATLAAAGYDVTIYGLATEPTTVSGVAIKPVPTARRRVSRALVVPWLLARSLLRERADLYHFHDAELIPLGLFLRVIGKRVVYDAHEWLRGDVGSRPEWPPPLRKALATVAWTLEQVAARVLSHVVTATPFIASQFPARRTTVVHNYPMLREFSDGDGTPWRDRPIAALYVGNLSNERCGRELLEAMTLLAAEQPDAQLLMAGPIEDDLDQRFGPTVTHLGYLDRASVTDLMGRGRCGVVLLRDLPNCLDALPGKFFEYLAAGLPVVVSRSTRQIARITEERQCGVTVDETDPVSIAKGIATLLAAEDESREMGARGRAAVFGEFHWEPEGRKLVALYDSLLQSRGGRFDGSVADRRRERAERE